MALAGKNGSVLFDRASSGTFRRLEQVSTWTMDMKTSTVDVTNMDGDGWKEYLATFREWTGKVESEFAMTNTSGQQAFFNSWLSGEILAFKLKLSPTQGFECSGTISDVSVSTAVGDKVKLSYSIQGTAGITYNPAMT